MGLGAPLWYATVSSLKTMALIGPTACGKTAAALALAQAHPELPLEIISMDSALVYRGMDIGTAKPTVEDRAQVPHHLIDIIEPEESYNAGQFARDANRLVGEIHARGKHAVIVGGTMLYLKALTHGLHELPQADEAVRQAIARQAANVGWPAMHEALAKVDAETAARLAPADSQRVGRALEIWHLTGRTMASFHAQAGVSPKLHVPTLAMLPQERAWLHERLTVRFDAMLQAGFLQEMARLHARKGLSLSLPSMRCVGYRQAWEALDSKEPLAATRARALAASRQLAKRQITWLRSMHGDGQITRLVACDAPDALAQAVAAMRSMLS